MKKFSLGARKRPSNAAPTVQQWRAYDDGPISLTARSNIDAATGQRVFVLAFAAVAVAGAAYFTTVMLSPESDRTSVVSTANAAVQDIRESAAPPVAPAPAKIEQTAPAAPAKVAATEPGIRPVNTPDPVRVKTTIVSSGKTALASAAPVERASEVQPIVQQAAIAPVAPPTPAQVQIAAVAPLDTAASTSVGYATANDGLLSEGVAAVMSMAIREGASRKAPVQEVASNKPDDEPEMAGSGRAGTINSAVTMRASPSKGGAPIGTIPTNASVNVAPGCKSWCQVSYNGKSGYIYKGFLR